MFLKNILAAFILFSAIQISPAQVFPGKKVLFENYTGAWCGRCPFGDWIAENSISAGFNPNVILVNMHWADFGIGRADSMHTAVSDSLVSTYYTNIGGPPFPRIMIDRVLYAGEPTVMIETRDSILWKNLTSQALAKATPFAINVTGGFTAIDRQLQGTVTVNVLDSASGDFRIHVWVIEDGVTGTGKGFDQANYDNASPGRPHFQKGNPIIGYIHNRTFRGSATGTWGTGGVLPSIVSSGQNFILPYTYTVPGNHNQLKTKVVAFISRHDSDLTFRNVLNATETPVVITGIEDQSSFFNSKLFIYPNPSSNQFNIKFSPDLTQKINLEIYNITGQLVHSLTQTPENGEILVDLSNQPLSSGLYHVRVVAYQSVYHHMVQIQH